MKVERTESPTIKEIRGHTVTLTWFLLLTGCPAAFFLAFTSFIFFLSSNVPKTSIPASFQLCPYTPIEKKKTTESTPLSLACLVQIISGNGDFLASQRYVSSLYPHCLLVDAQQILKEIDCIYFLVILCEN